MEKESKSVGLEKKDAMNRARLRVGVTEIAAKVGKIRQPPSTGINPDQNGLDWIGNKGLRNREVGHVEIWPRFTVERLKGVAAAARRPPSRTLRPGRGGEEKRITVNACVEKEDFRRTLFEKYSRWEKLRRIVAWVVRAAHMLLQSRTKSVASTGSPEKLEEKVPFLSLSDVKEAER